MNMYRLDDQADGPIEADRAEAKVHQVEQHLYTAPVSALIISK